MTCWKKSTTCPTNIKTKLLPHPFLPISLTTSTPITKTPSIMPSSRTSQKLSSHHSNPYPPTSRNSSPSHAFPFRTIKAEDFAKISRRREDLTLFLSLFPNDSLSCHELLFIDHLNQSIRVLEKTKQTLEIEIESQKYFLQTRLDKLFEKKLASKLYQYAVHYAASYNTRLSIWMGSISPPPLSPTASEYKISPLSISPTASEYKTAPSIIPQSTSPSSEYLRLAKAFLDEFFPDGAPRLGLPGNPIIVNNEDDSGSQYNPILVVDDL